MATTNYERVGKSLDLLHQGVKPLVEREMRRTYGGAWLNRVSYTLHDKVPGTGRDEVLSGDSSALQDIQALLVIMWEHWNEVFRDTLVHAERSLVSEVREWRNQWAHQQPFSHHDAYRALDSAARLRNRTVSENARTLKFKGFGFEEG